jgi:DHA1 family bicyclomycin/chloramphenicol resistance-like MFS transporter
MDNKKIPLLILSALSVTSTMPMDLYGPSMPEVARWFSAPAGVVQLTIGAYLLGFTAGQLIYGGLSDTFGRKPFLIASQVIFLAATIACALAGTIEQLIVYRIIQGIGSAGSTVLARVILLDTRQGERAARDMAIISSIAMMSPILSPILSGYLVIAGWQLIFWILAILAIGLLGYCTFILPETNPAGGERRITLPQALSGYLLVLHDRTAIGFLLLLGFAVIGVATFLTAAPFLFENVYGLGPRQFSYYLAFVMSGPAVGATISARLVYRLGTTWMVNLGVAILSLAGVFLALFSWLDLHLWFLLACAFAYAVGLSMSFPNIIITMIGRFQRNSGAASALLGVSQFMWSAIAIAIFARIEQTSAMPMSLFIMGAGLSAGMVWVLLLGRRLS